MGFESFFWRHNKKMASSNKRVFYMHQIIIISLPPVSITAPSSLVAKAPDAESTLRRENKFFPRKF